MNTTLSYSHWHVQDGADSSARDVWVITVMCTFLCAGYVFEEYMSAVKYTAVSSATQCLLLVWSGCWSSLYQLVRVSRYIKAANTFNSKVNETCFVVGRKCYCITYRSCSYAVWKQRRKWFLVNDQRDAQIVFYVFISIYNSLHVSSTSCSSSGETNCINTACGNSHSMLMAEMCAGWKKTHVFVSPDDEHCWLETCREL